MLTVNIMELKTQKAFALRIDQQLFFDLVEAKAKYEIKKHGNYSYNNFFQMLLELGLEKLNQIIEE